MYGYIYLTTNLINNKKYIGQHKCETFDKNYFGSGSIFKKALKKYGKDNFSISILCECCTAEELNEKEKYYINLYNAVGNDAFYNVNYGGYREGSKNLIFVHNVETGVSQLINPEKLAEYLLQGYVAGTGTRNDEQKKNYANSWGTARGNITITNGLETKYIFEDEINTYLTLGYRLGRVATRPNQKQENRKWVNDGEKSFMVSADKLDSYLSNGYLLGRVKFKTFNKVAPPHNKGKIRIHKDEKIKYINIDELDNYLLNGWVEFKHKNIF